MLNAERLISMFEFLLGILATIVAYHWLQPEMWLAIVSILALSVSVFLACYAHATVAKFKRVRKEE